MEIPVSKEPNTMKWGAIDQTIRYICDGHAVPKPKLNDFIFNSKVYAAIKYDGTNVGIDENGLMYGRNLCIHQDAESYQKCKLDYVKKIDAAAIKQAILD